MLKVALLYRSREGQTLKILNQIMSFLSERGHSVSLFDLSDRKRNIDLNQYDAFLLGCSIRYGRHHKDFCQFIERHVSSLNQKYGVFFSVNLTARKPERCRPDNNRYLMKYLQRTRWKPNLVDVFAGALLYSRYNFFQQTYDSDDYETDRR